MEYSLFRLLHWFHFVLIALGVATLLGTVASVSAQETHYTDVEAEVWYEEAASALLDSGALDDRESRLRPNDLATRAEVMKMLVQVYGGDLVYPETQSFVDVPPWTWYYTYVETAARAGWIRGDGNCYAISRPCTARPADPVNRAEMAILLNRAFNLQYMALAPIFPDNRQGAWYFIPIQTAADHCILQGDARTGNVRPASSMNRAEMIVMFHRASLNQEYGRDCSFVAPTPDILGVSVTSNRKVRVTFNVSLDRTIADDTSRYVLSRIGGGSVGVSDVLFLNDDTVELDLASSLIANASYRLTVTSLRTDEGRNFSDTETFSVPGGLFPAIIDIDVQGPTLLRVTFNMDVDAAIADDTFRYTVEKVSGGGDIAIQLVTMVDDHSLDLRLANALEVGTTYLLTASLLRTEAGIEFSDSATFTSTEPLADMLLWEALSPTRIRLTFNTPLDVAVAANVSHYQVTTGNRVLSIGLATVVGGGDTLVDLLLDEAMQTQHEYVIQVTNLRTAGNVLFSDSGSFLFTSSTSSDLHFDAVLTGAQEVPSVSTVATGSGNFLLTSAGLQYEIEVQNLTGSLITAAHFHTGAAGVAGPVVEPITFSGTRASGTWTNLTATERDDILNGRIYVNVHTAANPNGEIRGQVLPK